MLVSHSVKVQAAVNSPEPWMLQVRLKSPHTVRFRSTSKAHAQVLQTLIVLPQIMLLNDECTGQSSDHYRPNCSRKGGMQVALDMCRWDALTPFMLYFYADLAQAEIP